MKLVCRYTDVQGWTIEWEAIEGRMVIERFSRPEKALARLASIWPFINLKTEIMKDLKHLRSLNKESSQRPRTPGVRSVRRTAQIIQIPVDGDAS